MSRYTGSRAAQAPRGSGQLWAGILIGMVIGAGIATIFTWYMMKAPSPFLKELPVAEAMKPQPPAEPPATVAKTQAAATNDGKPRFEFYNMLTDKQNSKPVPVPTRQAEKSKPAEARVAETKPAATYVPQILQVGSFSSAVDAEKLKAKLALIGAEANVQQANVPDKGVYYRVRLGPYKSEEEMNRAKTFLRQNDIESTPMRVQ